jgi:PBP1b-binding outer membrane lipoprotein LpoB
MRRKLVIVSLLLMLALILSSCGTQPATQQQYQPEYKFVGSINSDKYHYPDCEWAKKIKPENQVWFSSPEEARKAGYKPCKVCRPPGHRLLD